jgi:hypothetical protein
MVALMEILAEEVQVVRTVHRPHIHRKTNQQAVRMAAVVVALKISLNLVQVPAAQ